jgi:hypothetical protein
MSRKNLCIFRRRDELLEQLNELIIDISAKKNSVLNNSVYEFSVALMSIEMRPRRSGWVVVDFARKVVGEKSACHPLG